MQPIRPSLNTTIIGDPLPADKDGVGICEEETRAETAFHDPQSFSLGCAAVVLRLCGWGVLYHCNRATAQCTGHWKQLQVLR